MDYTLHEKEKINQIKPNPMQLITLKNQLSEELRKTKRERNHVLINELHEQINTEKAILNKGFQNRRAEKMTESVKLKQELDRKKSTNYKRVRAERVKKYAIGSTVVKTKKKK